MLALLAPLLNSVFGAAVGAAVDGYKARLAAGNTSERIAADHAAKELELDAKQRELATQLSLNENGRWWQALPRAMVHYSFAIWVTKCVVWDNVLGLGSTDPLGGDLATWAGWVMALWFGGRSAEKIARILKR